MHVLLVHPEIAGNTGNIIRLCANTGAKLHLVEPLGFLMEDARLKRAGLDYHEYAEVVIHPDTATAVAALAGSRRFAYTARATARYDQVEYRDDDVLVFGAERSGLTAEDIGDLDPTAQLALPMRPHNRSLNVGNTVAVVVYEAWRQLGFPGAGPPRSPVG